MNSFRSGRAPRLLVAAVVAGTALLWPLHGPTRAEEGAPPGPAAGQEIAGLPSVLEGVDLTLPTPSAFRDWPPASLLERPYWLPWGPSAFVRAKLFGRPVLLLLTVPWSRPAQRMMSETLSDPKVLRNMNHGFITVLVNGDRRPDVRDRYASGSWPAVFVLLPDGNPMLSQANPAGKALPISAGALDVPGMLFLLDQASLYFQKWSSLLRGVGEVWSERDLGAEEAVPGPINEEASDRVARWLLGNADQVEGGFGAAPRFTVPFLMEYAALREARHTPALMDHAVKTLTKMAASPLYDAKDGGIHRVALSPGWKDIQYEKTLLSNAFFVRDLTVALRGQDSEALRGALRETSRFILRVLGREGGGFYQAQSADPTSPDGSGYWTVEGQAAQPPPIDRLVLSGPNALAGASLLRAAAILGDDELYRAGRSALDLVLERAYEKGRGVDHIVEPQPDRRRHLTTQADVAIAFVDAYESSGDSRYLVAARDVVDFCLNNLREGGKPALLDHFPEPLAFGTMENPRRPMAYNIRLARAMNRLRLHGAGEGFGERAFEIVGAFTGDLVRHSVQATEAGLAVEELIREPLLIRIDGSSADPAAQTLRRAALRSPWGWTVVTTGPSTAARPAAVLSFRGASSTVEQAAKLHDAIRALTEGPVPDASGN